MLRRVAFAFLFVALPCVGGLNFPFSPSGGVVRAQQAPTASPKGQVPIAVAPAGFAVSARVSDLPPATGRLNASAPPPGIATRPGNGLPVPRITSAGDGVDGALQTSASQNSMVAPIVSFDGLSNANILAVYGIYFPFPNTTGDVGPNRYVQMVHGLFRVFNKTGTPLTTGQTLSDLFNPLGGTCAIGNTFSLAVLYDPLADRWVLSEVMFTAVTTPPYHTCMAVSKTPDPTGEYYLYDFVLPGNEYPDEPKFGVWPDGYYMSAVQWLNGTTFDGAGVFAFDRVKMLAGDPTAGLIHINVGASYSAVVGLIPSDFDGLIAPPTGRANTFANFTATEFSDPKDGLRLFDFHADFATPANSTFIERPESSYANPLAVAAFDPTSPSLAAIGPDIQQPPPATNSSGLEATTNRLMHRLQYRNSGTVESLVLSHTVGAPASSTIGVFRAGVRYYQLTRNVSGGPFGVLEQGTYAPADGTSRWVPSVAADHSGNIAAGFSASSASIYPSLRYAGRLASDPAGSLAQGEATLVAGSGVQTNTGSLWSFTSALTVDPVDDCTFWFTGEYYTAASQAASDMGWLTRIGSFKYSQCTASSGALQGTITSAYTNSSLADATILVSNGFATMSGTFGAYSRQLAPGTYSVSVSKPGFLSYTADNVVITSGNTTTLDIALTGVPVMTANGTTVVGEGFAPPNGEVDPGERVTVNFALKNTGLGPTSSLVATLLATGGVLNPTGPSIYSPMAPNGSGSQSFTFRANPALTCGAQFTASLHLTDTIGGSALDLGTATFPIWLGGNSFSPLQGFDGVVAPALPAGWVAANASGPAPLWVTTTATPDAGLNAAFVDDAAVTSDKRLDSAAFTPSAGATLTFRNHYNTEPTYDGGVLEISIAGGAFTDVIAAGGSWVTGGYNVTLYSGGTNPLKGKGAWSGDSAAYLTSTVLLPAAAAGQSVKVRFRLGTDTGNAAGGVGWWIDSLSLSSRVCATGPYMIADNVIVTDEGLAPPNNAIDPGETVGVLFYVKNTGTGPSTDLTATLLPTGGVLAPPPAQYVGAVSVGASNGPGFTFRANPALACSGQLTASMQLNDGAADLGIVSFPFILGGHPPVTQNFDGVVAPALPAGWTATNYWGPNPLWTTATDMPDSGANALFVDDPDVDSDKRIDSQTFTPLAGAQLTFRHSYDLEAGSNIGFDGGVLEISINGGTFTDIITAGGSWVAGGYNTTISLFTGSTIFGRAAWSGFSNGYVTTTVNLPPAAAGQPVKFRFRMVSDTSNFFTFAGWFVDSVVMSGPCAPGAGEFVRNGTFAGGSTNWQTFSTPDSSYISASVVGGRLQFSRVPPPPGTSNQATVFQETGVPLGAGAPILAQFDLGNTSSVRKYMKVLVVESDFSDFAACTFWLPASAPMRTFQIKTHTTKAWTNAAIYFYAGTANAPGDTGVYQVDNVSIHTIPGQATDHTDCVDPLAPVPPGGSSGLNMLTNGNFGTGLLTPWTTFGTITAQITSGVLQMIRPSSTPPAGVVLQATGQPLTSGQILTATFQLGNSSGVRKRVTAIMHDLDFSDLAACVFWLAPNQPLSAYSMVGWASKAWTNATMSFYAATIGPDQWTLVDNVVYKTTPSTATTGSTCVEPVIGFSAVP